MGKTNKMTPGRIIRCRGNVFIEPFPDNNKGILRQTHRLSFDTTRTAKKMTFPTFLILLHVFIAAGACLPSRCLATIRGIHVQIQRLMGGIYEVCR
jgi:hypothetical protein